MHYLINVKDSILKTFAFKKKQNKRNDHSSPSVVQKICSCNSSLGSITPDSNKNKRKPNILCEMKIPLTSMHDVVTETNIAFKTIKYVVERNVKT